MSTSEMLVTELKQIATDLGRAPMPDEINEHSSRTVTDYRKQFGSWANALDTAGLEPPNGLRIPEDALIAELRRLADELDKTPSEQDMNSRGHHGAATYSDRFGSWNDAIEAADLDPRRDRTKRSREQLLADLKKVAEKLGRSPSQREMAEYTEFAINTYRNQFGSWNQALEAAGLERRPPKRKLSRDDLLDELTRLADELEKPPTTTEMQQDGDFSPGIYIDRFGSWNAALEAAGFEIPNQNVNEE